MPSISRRLVGLALCQVAMAQVDLKDFSNDLASDLAPLVSLFGENLTKQFLSECTSNWDYFIFAMCPIGIITAIICSIRVRGGTWMKAFIGYAQQSDSSVEAELCSSTGRDVCELFSNGSVARVLGRPQILEIIHFPEEGVPGGDASASQDGEKKLRSGGEATRANADMGLFLFRDHLRRVSLPRKGHEKGHEREDLRLWYLDKSRSAKPEASSQRSLFAPESELSHDPRQSAWKKRISDALARLRLRSPPKTPDDAEKGPEPSEPPAAATAAQARHKYSTTTIEDAFYEEFMQIQHPNLALNINIVRASREVTFLVAAVGFLLQGGLLAIAGVLVFREQLSPEDNSTPPPDEKLDVKGALQMKDPWFYIVGTVLLCAGMFWCAKLVGDSTAEVVFRRRQKKAQLQDSGVPGTRYYWLQPGNQIIGDQTFDAHAYDADEKYMAQYLISIKTKGTTAASQNLGHAKTMAEADAAKLEMQEPTTNRERLAAGLRRRFATTRAGIEETRQTIAKSRAGIVEQDFAVPTPSADESNLRWRWTFWNLVPRLLYALLSPVFSIAHILSFSRLRRKLAHNQVHLGVAMAASISLAGYILQFVGLRGMTAWVSIAQLAATILMSLIRGALRMRRKSPSHNWLSGQEDLVVGHELDWLAFELYRRHWTYDVDRRGNLLNAKNQGPRENSSMAGSEVKEEPVDPGARDAQSASEDGAARSGSSDEARAKQEDQILSVTSDDKDDGANDTTSMFGSQPTEATAITEYNQFFLHVTGQSSIAQTSRSEEYELAWGLTRLLAYRGRLAELTGHRVDVGTIGMETTSRSGYQHWPDEQVLVRKAARQLEAVLSDSLRIIQENVTRTSQSAEPQMNNIRLSLSVTTRGYATIEDIKKDGARWYDDLKDVTVDKGTGKHSGWKVDTVFLESVLGLWLWSIRRSGHDGEHQGDRMLSAEHVRRARILSVDPLEGDSPSMKWIQDRFKNWSTVLQQGRLFCYANADQRSDVQDYGNSLTLFCPVEAGNNPSWRIVECAADTDPGKFVRFMGWNVIRNLENKQIRHLVDVTPKDPLMGILDGSSLMGAKITYCETRTTLLQDCCQELYAVLLTSVVLLMFEWDIDLWDFVMEEMYKKPDDESLDIDKDKALASSSQAESPVHASTPSSPAGVDTPQREPGALPKTEKAIAVRLQEALDEVEILTKELELAMSLVDVAKLAMEGETLLGYSRGEKEMQDALEAEAKAKTDDYWDKFEACHVTFCKAMRAKRNFKTLLAEARTVEGPEEQLVELLAAVDRDLIAAAAKQAEKRSRYDKMVSDIASVFFAHGLGTEEEAMQCLLPIFRPILVGYEALI